MTRLPRRALLAAIPAALAAPALAYLPRGVPPGTVYASRRGVAVDGTDVTAYFTEGRPAAGSADHSLRWAGATWRFANAAARTAFAADPHAYAPQYGGWCAWAVAEGYLAPTVPEAWAIVDGRLYLNFSRRIQRRWERDIPGNIARGDANWPDLRG
jgi:hypothetical protein